MKDQQKTFMIEAIKSERVKVSITEDELISQLKNIPIKAIMDEVERRFIAQLGKNYKRRPASYKSGEWYTIEEDYHRREYYESVLCQATEFESALMDMVLEIGNAAVEVGVQ